MGNRLTSFQIKGVRYCTKQGMYVYLHIPMYMYRMCDFPFLAIYNVHVSTVQHIHVHVYNEELGLSLEVDIPVPSLPITH